MNQESVFGKNRKRQNRKIRREGRRSIWGKQENSKITRSREENRQGNGKDTRKAGGNESRNKRGNKADAKREPRRQEKNRTTREEFKNREQKWEEEKNNISERVV
ncbi:hypothetical protein MTP99_018739 [Tenebrio molitor]|jgi:hypothetical protein|nr:hypothetical protein MTP99_018739 [Tenebrio molitor]